MKNSNIKTTPILGYTPILGPAKTYSRNLVNRDQETYVKFIDFLGKLDKEAKNKSRIAR
ncbi:MAG: hypothetical protein AB8G05_24165 [Oligoflexales bacterium]